MSPGALVAVYRRPNKWMTKFLFAALILLPRLTLCQRHDVPPQLDLRAELNSDASELKVSWVNRGATPFLITVGSMIGWAGLVPNLQLSISGPGLPTGRMSDTSQPGAIAGRAESLVVCLASGTEYSMKFATGKLLLPDYKTILGNMRDRRWTVIVSYTGTRAFRTAPGGGRIPYDVIRDYPVEYPFWTGGIQAEVVNPPER
jgi:hypothetical protein